MKVLIVSTFHSDGGAAIAAKRIAESLKKQSVDAEFLFLMHKNWNFRGSMLRSGYQKLRFFTLFIIERLLVRMFISHKKYLFKFSLPWFGTDFTNHPAIQRADIINFHWVHFSFFSISAINQLAATKQVFWTMQDMWLFTGGCHYTFDCLHYRDSCSSCFYMKQGFQHIPKNILKHKQELFAKKSHFHIIASSFWMQAQAAKSTLLKNVDIEVIPNAIDLDVFKPLKLSHGKKGDGGSLKVLVGAVDTKDPRKGFQYLDGLIKAMISRVDQVELLVFGSSHLAGRSFDCKITFLGALSGDAAMSEVYGAADVYVHLAVQDNAPLVVLEALACGIPVVSFDSGGVGDVVVSGETGFLAAVGDVEGMADGIARLSDDAFRERICGAARRKAVAISDSRSVANAYCNLFRRFYRASAQ